MIVHIDMALGPVQGFVAQSRRTRDLWGSSYLLSFLSAHAMRGALGVTGARIIRPQIDPEREPLLRWVSGSGTGAPPRIGSVPNHFVFEAEEGVAKAVPGAAESAMKEAWTEVCEAVWRQYVAPVVELGNDSLAIWRRQVDAFWEFVWVQGPAGERDLLRRRKRWRTHRGSEEPGDKCMVMPELQELSGWSRSHPAEKSKQEAFWRALRVPLGPLDLRETEKLSAVALVKRLYPKIGAKTLGWELDSSHWQSTVYVGAIPWIRKVAAHCPEEARTFGAAVVRRASGVVAEKAPTLVGPARAATGDFARLDANYFHESFLADDRLCPLNRVDGEAAQQAARRELVDQLKRLRKAVGEAPPTYYAILLADGDKLGDLVQALGGAKVGEALAKFTSDVPDIVSRHDGVTIYAGGDDVLAMMPVPQALACAEALADRYARAFDGATATLSAAVVFTHVRLPLRSALTEARRLLDDVAKEANGRDSLAACVLKRGGLHCEWASTWRRDGGSSVALLTALAEHLGLGDPEETAPENERAFGPGFSAALLHRLHATLGLLCGWPSWRPGEWATPADDLDLQAFLLAEVRRSLSGRVDEARIDAAAAGLTAAIAAVLGRSPRTPPVDAGPEIGVDALLLARFLASGGAEEEN